MRLLDLNSGSLEVQSVLLPAEPSLQTPESHFLKCVFVGAACFGFDVVSLRKGHRKPKLALNP